MYQINVFSRAFKTYNSSLLSIPETEKNALKRPEHYRKVTQETPKNPEFFVNYISSFL